MGLCDRENAIGEVLAGLVTFIVPNYDGRRTFDRWARMCIRQKLINQLRTERRAEAFIARLPPGASAISVLELLPDRDRPGCDLKFLEIVAELDDQQAAILWLRYYRGMPANAIGAMLKMSPDAWPE